MASRIVPGTRIGGYRLEEELGRGGMGAVFRAVDERLGRVVALKLLERTGDGLLAQRFQREGEAASRVVDPHVVTVHAAGEDGPWLFIAMELVPGGSLADRLKRGGALPWREAARLGGEIARGLEAIHAAGFVHRDLKPANVLLASSAGASGGGLDHAKLADFGLSRSLDPEAARLTRTTESLGTVAYMAPEQAEGGRADARSDLYGLGATLHALVAGSPPFGDGSAIAVLRGKLLGTAPHLSSVAPGTPAELDALVQSLLASDPAARPSSAREVAETLEAIARGREGSGASAPSRPAPLVVRVVLGALVLTGIAGGALFVARQGRALLLPPATPIPTPAAPPTATPTPRATPAETSSPASTPLLADAGPAGSGIRVARSVVLPPGTAAATLIVCAPLGDRAAAGTEDGQVLALDPSTLEITRTYRPHTKRVTGLELTADARAFVSSSWDGIVQKWEWGAIAGRWQAGGRGRIVCLALAPGGVLVGTDESLAVLDLETGDALASLDLEPGTPAKKRKPAETIMSIASGPHRTIWTANRKGVVQSWDMRLEKLAPLPEYAPAKGLAHVAVSSGGHFLASWENGAIGHGAIDEDGKPGVVSTLAAPARSKRSNAPLIAISLDGRRGVTATESGAVVVWDLTGAGVKLAEIDLPSDRRIRHAAFLPDANAFLATTDDSRIVRFELDAGPPK